MIHLSLLASVTALVVSCQSFNSAPLGSLATSTQTAILLLVLQDQHTQYMYSLIFVSRTTEEADTRLPGRLQQPVLFVVRCTWYWSTPVQLYHTVVLVYLVQYSVDLVVAGILRCTDCILHRTVGRHWNWSLYQYRQLIPYIYIWFIV